MSGIRADRARSRRSAAAPAVDPGVPSEVRRRADGDGAADRQSPARHRIGGVARGRDRAEGDRLGRPGPGAHAPGGRAHERTGAARAPAARGVAARVVERVSRFACLWVECFVAAAVERSEPALRAAPLAVVAPAPSVTRVVDANPAAREYGVRAGVTETEARARCPTLVSRPFVREHVAAARHALLEAALGVSPRVEDGGAGLVYVDAAGLTWLHGDPAAVGRRLVSQARGVGFPGCRVALAGSRTAARVAAVRAAEPVMVVPPGAERAALAGAPLAALDLAPDLVATLEGWGVRTLGELAALPRDGLAVRLGPAGLRAHDLALGHDRDPFCAWTPPPFWDEAQGLEWEIDSLGALAVVLDAVLGRLCARLVAASLAADALDVRLELASGGHHARAVALAVPMCEVKPMLALLTLDLEAHPPAAAVTRVTVSAHPVRARAGQGGLWQPPAPRLRDLVAVLARLAALVGPDNVGSPRLDDSHRPDAYALTAFAPPDEPGGAGGGRTPRPDPPLSDAHRLVLRRVRPARRVAVATDDERPSRVDGQCVVGCAGPWRASGAWWDVQAWARDEWDVALGDGTLCRLARDLTTDGWSLDGVYD
ncbi:MAG: hypothetical protein DME14_13625 [Candidatus Rokuibacteriota bacterium]|nr:MAG: hypothetical protein DME14_13625 [Candidatus Rokubacteria bacterium]